MIDLGLATAAGALVLTALLPWTQGSTFTLAWPIPAGGSLVPALVALVMGLLLSSPLMTWVVPWAVVIFGRRTRRRRRRIAATELAESVPPTIDAAIVRLNSGASLQGAVSAALAENARLASTSEISSALEGVAAGERLDRALERVVSEASADWLALTSTCLSVLAETGGQRGPALERLSDTLRSSQAARRESSAQAAQAQASAVVLGVLPLVFACLIAIASPRAREFYWATSLGALCLGSSLALTVMCWAAFDRVLGRGPR